MAKNDTQQEELPALPWENAEGMGLDFEIDSGLPLINIIQGSSPQIKKSHPKYEEKKIVGAEEGDVFINGKDFALDRPFLVVPLSVVTLYDEWAPRDSGKGIIAHHDQSILDHTTASGKNGMDQFLDNGNEIIKTLYVAVYVQVQGVFEHALFAFKKTNLKAANQWLNSVKSFVYPTGQRGMIFSCLWKCDTRIRTKDDDSWYVFTFEKEKTLDMTDESDRSLMDACYTDISKGIVKENLLPKPGETNTLTDDPSDEEEDSADTEEAEVF